MHHALFLAAEPHSLWYSWAGAAVWVVSYLMFGVLALAVLLDWLRDAHYRRQARRPPTRSVHMTLRRRLTRLRERFERPIRPVQRGRGVVEPDDHPGIGL